MKNNYQGRQARKSLWWVLALVALTLPAYSQSVVVEVKLESVWSNVSDETSGPCVNRDRSSVIDLSLDGTVLYDCLGFSDRNTYRPNIWGGPRVKYYNNGPLSGVTLGIRGYANNKGETCEYNGGPCSDRFQQWGSKEIDFSQLAPGVFSDEIEVVTDQNNFRARVRVRYSLIPPQVPSVNSYQNPGLAGPLCADKTATLQTSISMPNQTGLQYRWQYHRKGDEYEEQNPELDECLSNCQDIIDPGEGGGVDRCRDRCYRLHPPYVTVENWYDLPLTPVNADNSVVTFVPNALLTGGIKNTTEIEFRVRAESREGLVSAYRQSNGFFSFAPPAPTISATNYRVAPSCPNGASGAITVSGLVGSGTYKYILTSRDQPPIDVESCINNNTCQTLGRSETVGNDFQIANVAAGDYTLWLSNPGGTQGICYTQAPVTVPVIPTLQVSVTPTAISCAGASDGGLTFSQTGGVAPYQFTVTNAQGTVLYNNAQAGNLSALTAGTYTVKVTDGCQQVSQQVVELTQPTQVRGRASTANATCRTPGNGGFQVTASGGSGLYNYRLVKADNSPMATQNDSPQPQWSLSNLSAGEYQLSIRDARRPACEGFDTTFTIEEPPLLSITDVQPANIACPGARTGSIRLTAAGGTGGYQYRIAAEGLNQQNDTGLFEDLPAGSYTVSVGSAVSGCADGWVWPTPVILSQPSPLALASTKTDNRCFGESGGSISARVSGGNGGYTYRWERLLNGGWSSVSGATTPELSNLPAGDYRFTVSDGQGCEATSAAVAISQPAELKMSEVVEERPGCSGQQAYLQPVVSGGVAPYVYEYALDNGSSYVVFTPTTLLALGTYTLRVTDANGCRYQYPETRTLTENAIRVGLTATPVCYKSNNGALRLKGTGGRPPYQYSIDNGQTFQEDGSFANLLAGSYAVVVKDDKGCSAATAATVEQRQEKPEINFLVATRQNALDTLVVVEVSVPKPDSVRWSFDARTQVVDGQAVSPKIKFDQAGSYAVAMTGYFSGCAYTLTKTLVIDPYDPKASAPPLPGLRPIEQLKLYPNPNDGRFTVEVKLLKKQPLVLVVVDMLGNEYYRQSWEGVETLSLPIGLTNPPNGTYLLRAITNNDAREIKLVVNQ